MINHNQKVSLVLIGLLLILLIAPVSAVLTTHYYYKDVVVSGSSVTQTNYITRFDLYRSTGTDTNSTLYIGTQNNATFADIYFTKSDDTPLSFVIEAQNDTYAAVIVSIPSLPTTGLPVRLYYGNATMSSAASTTLPGLISNISYSKDNNGNERYFFKDTFVDNTITDYVISGSPSIASGVLTMAYGSSILKYLNAGSTTGKWEVVAKFDTAYVATDQYLNLYCGATSFLQIRRSAGNVIKLYLIVNSSTIIAVNTFEALNDSTYGYFSVMYDGTNWKIYFNNTQYGSTTAGVSPSTPYIGLLVSGASAITNAIAVNELTYTPSIAYSDSTPGTNIARYTQVSGTVAASGANFLNVTTPSSAGSKGTARARSYIYGSGSFRVNATLPTTNVGDGDQVRIILSSDPAMTSGSVYIGAIRVSGVWKLLSGATGTDGGNLTTTVHDGDTITIELQRDTSTGTLWGYVYETNKPTTPSETFFKTNVAPAYVFYVVDNAAGTDPITASFSLIENRANSIVAEINVPAYETGIVFVDDLTVPDSGRFAGDIASFNWSDNVLKTKVGAGIKSIQMPQAMYTNYTLKFSVVRKTNEAGNCKFGVIFDSDRTGYTNVFGGSSIARNHILYFYNDNQPTATSIIPTKDCDASRFTPVANLPFVTDVKYYCKIIRSGTSIKVYYDTNIDPTTLVLDYVDTANLYGYIGFFEVVGMVYFDDITISGTRVYNAAQLRGAQVGNYWNGTAIINATWFSDDANWNLNSEYTGDVTITRDTTIGSIALPVGSWSQKTLNSQKFTDGMVEYQFESKNTGSWNHFVIRSATQDSGKPDETGNKYVFAIEQYSASTDGVRLYKTVGGTQILLGSKVNFPVGAGLWKAKITFVGSTLSMYIALVGSDYPTTPQITRTDSTFTSGFVGFGGYSYTSSLNIKSMQINAYSLTAPNGVSYMISGVGNGARYDTEEYVGLNVTGSNVDLLYTSDLFTTSTVTNPPGLNKTFKNIADATAVSLNLTPLLTQSITSGTTYLKTNPEYILLGASDNGNTVSGYISYPTKNDTSPATFVSTVWRSRVVPEPSSINSTPGDYTQSTIKIDPSVLQLPSYAKQNVTIYVKNLTDAKGVLTNISFDPSNVGITNVYMNNSLSLATMVSTYSNTSGWVQVNVSNTTINVGNTYIPIADIEFSGKSFSPSNTSSIYLKDQWLGNASNSLLSGYHNFTYALGGNFTVTKTVPASAFTTNKSAGIMPITGSSVGVQYNTSSSNATWWNWSFGDTTWSNVSSYALANVTHSYSAIGLYNITLYVSDAGYSPNSSTRSVLVYSPVYTDTFAAVPMNGTTPLLVQFISTEINATSWYWSFGDGNTSTLQSPINTYYSIGNYTVNHSATNALNTSWTNRTDYIRTATFPITNFSATPRSVSGGVPISFTDESTGTYNTWNWSFGDGTYSDQKNPVHIYTSSGYKTVSLTTAWSINPTTITNTTEKIKYIYISNEVMSGFTGDVTAGLFPLTVTFTVTYPADNASMWNWSFGDGTWFNTTNVLYRNPTHTYSSGGSYYVSERASDTNWLNTTVNTTTFANYITVHNSTTSNWSTNVTSGGLPLYIQFTDTSENATTYYWDFGDGYTSTTKSPIHVYTGSGTYSVNHSASNPYYISWTNRTSYIATLSPIADYTATPISGAAPLTVVFTDMSSSVTTNWAWDFGDGGTSTVKNPTHTYTSAGSYTVSLSASNSYGSDLEVKNGYINVASPPVANFYGTPTTGTYPLTVSFIDQTTVSPIIWSWNFGDGSTSSAQNPTHTYTTEGIFTVTLTAINNVGSNTVTKPGYISVESPSGDIVTNPISTNTSTNIYCVKFNGTNNGPTTTNVWFEYGLVNADNNGYNSFKTKNQTVAAGASFSDTVCGIPLQVGETYRVVAAGDIGGNYEYGTNRTFVMPTITPHTTGNYNNEVFVDKFVSDAFNPVELFSYDIWQYYLASMSGLFFAILIAFCFFNMAIKQRSVALVVLLLFLTGGAIFALMPEEFLQLGQAIMIAAVAGLLYFLFQRKR